VGGWPNLDPGHPDDAPLTTLQFTERGPSTTELALTVSFPESMSAARADEWLTTGMREGWGTTIDRLVARLR
jgi:uncharacterized protein YndB with AHSA1/START domain